MGPKWHELHGVVLEIMAGLTFGVPELRGDAKERMLRAWYAEFVDNVEDAAEGCAKKSPPA